MITRKSAILVLALLVLQFLGPLLHAHFSGPTAPTQTGMHLHAEVIPEFSDSATLETAGHLLMHEHQIKTVALQQALNAHIELVMPDWQLLLPILLLLLPVLMQSQIVPAASRLMPQKPHPYPDPQAPRAPPLA